MKIHVMERVNRILHICNKKIKVSRTHFIFEKAKEQLLRDMDIFRVIRNLRYFKYYLH